MESEHNVAHRSSSPSLRIARSYLATMPDGDHSGDHRTPAEPAPPAAWPVLDHAAYHGPAGALVRAIEPHTEADPVALLGQFLAGFGSLIGRSAHFRVEADQHYGNLFLVTAGETSKGRKGIAWSQIRAALHTISPQWVENRVKSGLSSGEGLIWNIRDPVEGIQAGRSHRRRDTPRPPRRAKRPDPPEYPRPVRRAQIVR